MPAFSFEKISPPLVRDNAAPEKTAPASVKTTRSVLVRMLDRLTVARVLKSRDGGPRPRGA